MLLSYQQFLIRGEMRIHCRLAHLNTLQQRISDTYLKNTKKVMCCVWLFSHSSSCLLVLPLQTLHNLNKHVLSAMHLIAVCRGSKQRTHGLHLISSKMEIFFTSEWSAFFIRSVASSSWSCECRMQFPVILLMCAEVQCCVSQNGFSRSQQTELEAKWKEADETAHCVDDGVQRMVEMEGGSSWRAAHGS